MTIYDDKVWLSQYDAAQRQPRTIEFDDALAMFRATVERDPDATSSATSTAGSPQANSTN